MTQKLLGAVITVVSGGALLYGLAGVAFTNDPLAVLLAPLIIIPGAAFFLLGIFIWRGQHWALIGLRICIIVIFAGGLFSLASRFHRDKTKQHSR